ncbi:MAG: GatB/YqeY domain protein [Acidobacteriaceae bacterium]|nr:GatB/YqeY domain protein [Acidobacteriaceae bacterium]
MSIGTSIQTDIITAMKAKDEHRLTTLRMVKSALKNKEIDKREPLTDAEEQQILTTLIKQRRESVESFTKGDRPELAAKEQVEIGMIEGYLPKAAGEEEIRKIVMGAIEHLTKDAGGVRPGPKDMGVAMNVVKQWLMAGGLRADGKLVSELVKKELNNG